MAKTFETIDPATEEKLEELEYHSPAFVDRALGSARRAFAEWRRQPMSRRAALLRSVATQLRDREEELASHAVTEMGKPIAQARAEIAKCARACDWFAAHAADHLADEPVTTEASESYVAFDPLGVVLAIMPWNFPYWQVFRAAAPALMAGNVMLLKHALNVSRCGLEIASIFEAAGAPDGLFQTLLVHHDVIPGVIRDDRVAAVTLTGSERAGVSVGKEAAGVVKKTILELGGSDAFIVLADADLEAAAETAVRARFQNNGQSCIAAKRFFVEAPVARDFIERFVARVRALSVGSPLLTETDIGPLARGDLREELDRQVRASVEAGARVLAGGGPVRGRGHFYQPTVLVDVPEDAPALTEELFGPVAPIVVVRDAEHAVERANASRYGLGGNLWTRDVARAKRIARDLESGSVFINGMTASDPRLPFGGIKRSGLGRELAAFGLRELVNVKTVWIGPAESGAGGASGENAGVE